MSKFPTRECDILALGEQMVMGLEENGGIYPAPPVNVTDFHGVLDDYLAARDAETAAHAIWEEAVRIKQAALHRLGDVMKTELRYAENTVDFDDEKLKLIGWGGRKPKAPPQSPGQVRALRITGQEEDSISLAWKAPVGGGRASAYKVQRREQSDGPWTDVGTAIRTSITLTNREHGRQLAFRVVAINRVGDGEPSNAVTAFL
uniref:Fibronectin type III domain-containing protein n=1 Tax=Candidatus Kentrum sp. FW TaxID=2126338 RepID=A0A450SEC1_9GAMM|nr:MAG: Fibronectin type III domain-containing protein [Candidatus Kentron sp. FW]